MLRRARVRGSEARAVHPLRGAIGATVYRRSMRLVRLRSLPMADVASVEAIGGRGSARGKRAHCTRRNRNALAALLGLQRLSRGESRNATLRLHSVLGRTLFALAIRATARLEAREAPHERSHPSPSTCKPHNTGHSERDSSAFAYSSNPRKQLAVLAP